MWNTTNGHGEDIIWYSKDEVKEAFVKIKNLCNGVSFQTNEANQLKDVILRIINEALNG